jgi:hypothetical protein
MSETIISNTNPDLYFVSELNIHINYGNVDAILVPIIGWKVGLFTDPILYWGYQDDLTTTIKTTRIKGDIPKTTTSTSIPFYYDRSTQTYYSDEDVCLPEELVIKFSKKASS